MLERLRVSTVGDDFDDSVNVNDVLVGKRLKKKKKGGMGEKMMGDRSSVEKCSFGSGRDGFLFFEDGPI